MNDNGVMVYDVKWKEYGDEHNSWLSLDDLADTTAKLDEFEAGAVSKINKVDGPTVCVVLISATMCVIKGDCGSRD